MARVTRGLLNKKFDEWLLLVGGRQAEAFNDVGAYVLWGGGGNDYRIWRILDIHGGTSVVFLAGGARDMFDAIEAGRQSIHAYAYEHKQLVYTKKRRST